MDMRIRGQKTVEPIDDLIVFGSIRLDENLKKRERGTNRDGLPHLDRFKYFLGEGPVGRVRFDKIDQEV
jgi:hypothetical protein